MLLQVLFLIRINNNVCCTLHRPEFLRYPTCYVKKTHNSSIALLVYDAAFYSHNHRISIEEEEAALYILLMI